MLVAFGGVLQVGFLMISLFCFAMFVSSVLDIFM